jgi:hypothetical protein
MSLNTINAVNLRLFDARGFLHKRIKQLQRMQKFDTKYLAFSQLLSSTVMKRSQFLEGFWYCKNLEFPVLLLRFHAKI